MVANLKAFERALERFGRETLPRAIAERQRALAREALRGLVSRTPVHTGQSRANWQVTLDAPARGVVDDRDPSGAKTLARGDAAIARSTPSGSIWITNNLSSLGALEHGGADRPPVAMVAATLASLSRQNRRGGKS